MAQKLEKAKIITIEPAGTEFEVLFNPTDYKLNRSNQFAEVAIPGLAAPLLQFAHGNAQTLTMQLFFDTYDPNLATGQSLSGNKKIQKDDDVRLYTSQVTDLLKINSHLHAPPICQFSWGNLNFIGVLQQADLRCTLFLPNGVPVRATVDVTFKQYYNRRQETGRLQSAHFAKQYVVRLGDTLSSIAADTYEDATRWRPIAEANNLDDPLDIAPGQVLIIPAIE